MAYKYQTFIFYVLITLSVRAQGPYEIAVGLEHAPGLLQQNGKGAIDMALHDIEKKSDSFHFSITYLSYLRAKIELEKGHIDMIGLTPKDYETKDFYSYARETDWSLDTDLVLFCNTHSALDLAHGEMVGTPAGNEGFVAETLKMRGARFVTGTLVSLVKRLKKHRIPCIAFEQYSVLKLAHNNRIKQLYFKRIAKVRGSFAFRKSFRNKKISKAIEEALRELNWNKYLKGLKKIPVGEETGKIYP